MGEEHDNFVGKTVKKDLSTQMEMISFVNQFCHKVFDHVPKNIGIDKKKGTITCYISTFYKFSINYKIYSGHYKKFKEDLVCLMGKKWTNAPIIPFNIGKKNFLTIRYGIIEDMTYKMAMFFKRELL